MATIKDYEKALLVDEHALNEELQHQPDLFYRVSKLLLNAISERDAAKQDLVELEARVDAEIRKDASVSGERVTEKEVESQKKLNPKVTKAIRDLHALQLQVAKYTALKEAYMQRANVLRDFVTLYSANYFSDASNGSSRARLMQAKGAAAQQRVREERRARSK